MPPNLKSGRRGSNPRPPPWQGGVLPLNYFRKASWATRIRTLEMTGPKPVALPLGYSPMNLKKMGRPVGFEPTRAGATIRCVNHFATTAIFIRDTILNYIGRGSRIRTHSDGFGDRSFAIKLYP